MTKKLEYCFIPVSDDGLSYRCLLCDYTSLISAGYVGYCNHIKYKHAKKEMPNEIDVFLKKYFEMAIRKFPNSYNSTLTEVENMRALGYDRIWDCGTIRYTWTKNT